MLSAWTGGVTAAFDYADMHHVVDRLTQPCGADDAPARVDGLFRVEDAFPRPAAEGLCLPGAGVVPAPEVRAAVVRLSAVRLERSTGAPWNRFLTETRSSFAAHPSNVMIITCAKRNLPSHCPFTAP